MSRRKVLKDPSQLNLLLTEVKLKILMDRGDPDMSDSELAAELGVFPGSLSQWKNGDRVPGMLNCIQLSKHPYIGDKIWEVVGRQPPSLLQEDDELKKIRKELSEDERLRYILLNFAKLDGKGKANVIEFFKELINGRQIRLVYEDEQGDDEPEED